MGSSVANIFESASTPAPVSRLNSVDFPAFVSPPAQWSRAARLAFAAAASCDPCARDPDLFDRVNALMNPAAIGFELRFARPAVPMPAPRRTSPRPGPSIAEQIVQLRQLHLQLAFTRAARRAKISRISCVRSSTFTSSALEVALLRGRELAIEITVVASCRWISASVRPLCRIRPCRCIGLGTRLNERFGDTSSPWQPAR